MDISSNQNHHLSICLQQWSIKQYSESYYWLMVHLQFQIVLMLPSSMKRFFYLLIVINHLFGDRNCLDSLGVDCEVTDYLQSHIFQLMLQKSLNQILYYITCPQRSSLLEQSLKISLVEPCIFFFKR